MAYAECSVKVVTGKSTEDCGCSLTDSKPAPHDHSLPDKQKDITLKTDWKYITNKPLHTDFQLFSLAKVVAQYQQAYHKEVTLPGVFHPPIL